MGAKAKRLKARARQEFARYIQSEGCTCCQLDSHDKHGKRLAKVLGMKMYPDNSGVDYRAHLNDANKDKGTSNNEQETTRS